jgi:hypothetical protein
VRLSAIDTKTGTAQTVLDSTALVGVPRVSLTMTERDTFVLAVERNDVELYELSFVDGETSWVGYAKVPGKLEQDIVDIRGLRVSTVVGGVRKVHRITSQELAAMTGAGDAVDADGDDIPDLLDGCPAVFSQPGQVCPSQVPAVLFASQKLFVADRVKTLGPNGPGALRSSGSLATWIGVDAEVGALHSTGPVELRDRAKVEGALVSAGNVVLRNGALATGGVKSNVGVQIENQATLSVTFPAAGNPITLQPDQSLRIQPGSYGNVSVGTRSQLVLSSGDYLFKSLTVEPQAALVIDRAEGPVRVYSKNSLIFRGEIIDAAGDEPNVLLGYTGTATAPIESSFDGTIVAPNAKLVLSSNPHAGAFFARELEVQAGAEITYRAPPKRWRPSGAVATNGAPTVPAPTPFATCSDGVQNQGEQQVDCGGPCAPCCTPTTYQAETMFHSTGGSVPNGWNIWSNGYISTNHTFPAGSRSITVNARGSAVNGVWARMVVSVGGVTVGTTFVNSTTFQPYTFNFTTTAGTKQVRVTFDNDLNIPPQDRNLYVDNVVVGCP